MGAWPALALGLAGGLLADDALAALFSPEAELAELLAFERALARAQHGVGEISAEALAAIEAAARPERLESAGLLAGLRRDGMAVPALVRQIRAALGEPHARAFHRGATSQDLLDTALMRRLKAAGEVLEGRLAGIIAALEVFAAAEGGRRVMARTRSQDAYPFTLADRIALWTDPLRDLAAEPPRSFPLQLGGAIGLRAAAYGPHHREIAEAMARELGLSEPGRPWHTDRRAIGAVAAWMASLATVLGKLGQDVTIMAQTPVAEIRVPGGSSSAMPHKQNPIGAELLVALARYVAGQQAILQGAALHESERSGVAWTLEWFALPPLVLAAGAATRCAAELVAGLEAGARG